MAGKHFYEDGEHQCSQRCVVGELGRGKVCVCELVSGHQGEHERIPTLRPAGVKESELPWYRSFVAAE